MSATISLTASSRIHSTRCSKITLRWSFITLSNFNRFLRMSKLRASTFCCAFSSALLIHECTIASFSLRPRRCSMVSSLSVPKIRIRSSSKDKKNLECPGSPCRPDRPRSWLSIRRDSCRSVPSTYRPPASTTSSCSWATARLALSTASGQAASKSSGVSTGESPRWCSSRSAMNSGLPPSMMSVPRPAMLVATVTAPLRPAWATMAASRSWFLAFSTSCGTPRRLSSRDSTSDFSTLVVPTRTGWPTSYRSTRSSATASNLACAVWYTMPMIRADHSELVDLGELVRLGHGGTGHAGQLVVEAEVVLQGDRGQGLVLVLDGHALFGLDSLVHALVVAAAVQDPPGELIHDQDLAVHHDVVLVPLVQLLGLDRVVQETDQRRVDRVVEVVDAEPVLDLLHAGLQDADGLLLLVDLVVALAVLAAAQPGRDLGELDVPAGALLGRTADDQRGPGLVDKDRVHLVDDRV